MSSTILAQYHFESWTTENGLPQNSILAILQTSDGYIWLATNDGLARFDGVKFTVFDAGNSPGFCCNRLTALYEDKDRVLWIGTDESKVIRYLNKKFTSFVINSENPNALNYSIQKDQKGSLLISTNYGLLRGRPDGNGDGFKIVRSEVRRHYLDQSGALWYVDRRRLYRDKEEIQTSYAMPVDGEMVTCIYEAGPDLLWIGTEDGLVRLKDGLLKYFTSKDGLPRARISAISKDEEGDLWIGTERGLCRFKDGKFTVYDTSHGLSSNNIRSLFLDREGSLWIGTVDQGLVKVHKTIITTLTQRDGLASDSIYPIFEDSRGTIWIGSWPKGLTRYQNGRFEQVNLKDKNFGMLPLAFGEDREGKVWISAGGLWVYKDGKFQDFSNQLPAQATGIHAIHQDKSGAMWFGSDHGLVRSDQGKMILYTKEDGLAGDEIKAIIEDKSGHLWIGTREGVSKYADGRFVSYTVKDGLKSNQVRALYEDEEGTIWIGTFDGGLSRIKDGRITTYNLSDGLFCKGVFQIFDDNRGSFWMGCNSGIYRVSKWQLNEFAEGKLYSITSISYGKKDGLLNVECNGGGQPAGIKSRDGKLWFPTQGGAAVVDLPREKANLLPPSLMIEKVVLNGKSVDYRQPVQLDSGTQNLEIHYEGLSFKSPEAIRFKYSMEGVDRGWVDAANRRVAYYPHLPPGQYRFRLSAFNSDGVGNELKELLEFTVGSPFWQRWWFISLILVSLVGVGYAFHRKNISKLEKEAAKQRAFSKQLIDSQEGERKRIARDLHDGVVQHLASLAISVFNLRRQVPESNEYLRQQMVEIHDRAMNLTEDLRHLSHSLHPAVLEHLGLFASIRSICDEFSKAEGIPVTLVLDDKLRSLSPEADLCLYRVVQEGLHNVAKHSRAGGVLVSLRCAVQEIELIISDDGVGFVYEESKAKGGLGLVSLEERVGYLGGKLRINSQLGKGTEIIVLIPLVRA